MAGQRHPAVAGSFYPSDPAELRSMVRGFLDAAQVEAPVPKAMIAPHAGYIYSGPIAGSLYARVEKARGRITRVVLLGPAHRHGFDGLAVHGADAFLTPLGAVRLDRDSIEAVCERSAVRVLDEAHRGEHSLEVHLPFLQTVLDDFVLVPIVAGWVEARDVADALEALWGGDETLIVISSDLSHYHDYESARAMDLRTTRAIEALKAADIQPADACGAYAVRGLLVEALRKGLSVTTVDLRNSGDTAGPRDEVVGYGAYAFT
jgi:MEMO1 family protein